jgi:hypothetical protein
MKRKLGQQNEKKTRAHKKWGDHVFFPPFFLPSSKKTYSSSPPHSSLGVTPLSHLPSLFRELGVKVGRGEGPCVFRMMNTNTAIQVLVHSVCSVWTWGHHDVCCPVIYYMSCGQTPNSLFHSATSRCTDLTSSANLSIAARQARLVASHSTQ